MTHAHVWQFQAGLINSNPPLVYAELGFQASEVMLQHGGFQSMGVALLMIHFRLGFSITSAIQRAWGYLHVQPPYIPSIHSMMG